MDYKYFTEAILKKIQDSQPCLCQKPGFQKLMSFDFRDYSIGPRALLDQSLIGNAMILQRFSLVEDWKPIDHSGAQIKILQCPLCKSRWQAVWEQFSINFDATVFTLLGAGEKAEKGLYLLGFYGFSLAETIPDFEPAASEKAFLESLGVYD